MSVKGISLIYLWRYFLYKNEFCKNNQAQWLKIKNIARKKLGQTMMFVM